MGWIITLVILILLAALPLGVSFHYDGNGPLLRLLAGPVKITLFPRPKKQKNDKAKPASKKKEKKAAETVQSEEVPQTPVSSESVQRQESVPAAASSQPTQPKPKVNEAELPKPPQPPKEENKGGSLMDFVPLVKLGIRFLGDFRRKLRLNNLQLKLILAGGDPCDLAVNYGKAWAAVSNLIPRLDSWFVIKKRDIQVECDFVASETLVYAHLDLTITLGRLLSLVLVYGLRGLKEYLNLKNKRKGGAVT